MVTDGHTGRLAFAAGDGRTHLTWEVQAASLAAVPATVKSIAVWADGGARPLLEYASPETIGAHLSPLAKPLCTPGKSDCRIGRIDRFPGEPRGGKSTGQLGSVICALRIELRGLAQMSKRLRHGLHLQRCNTCDEVHTRMPGGLGQQLCGQIERLSPGSTIQGVDGS